LAGGDVYDKLLVLRALKRSFPRVVFFSTDLDALYSDPGELVYTRNLVIASPFDLVLDGTNQMRTPPFRDSYQTSLFFSTLKALTAGGLAEPYPSPKVFEIGRTGAVELLTDSGTGKPWFYSLGIIVVLLVEMFLLGILLYPFSAGVRSEWNSLFPEQFQKTYFLENRPLFVFLAALFFFVFPVSVLHLMPYEEPFELFEGISVWPTEILRITAFFLTVYFFFRMRSRLNLVQKEVEEMVPLLKFTHEKSFKEFYKQKSGTLFPLLHIRHYIKNYWLFGVKPAEEVVETRREKSVWIRFVVLAELHPTALRAGFYTVLYFLFSSLLVVFFDAPIAPVRGTFSRVFDSFILLLSVTGYTFLLFAVLDITLLTNRFIDVTSRLLEKDSKMQAHQSIQIFARLSEEVARFVYFPFTVLFIMILSRNSLFDDWTWPGLLIAIFAASLFFIFATAILLQRSCAQAKVTALEHLRRRILETDEILVQTWTQPAQRSQKPWLDTENEISGVEEYRNYIKAEKAKMEAYVKAVENVNSGGFQSLAANPIFAAVLIPFGGLGSLALFEKLLNVIN
jgi:hypothetical protein